MDYKSFIKKFPFSPNFHAPILLTYEDLEAKPLTRADLESDMQAVNSSLELIRRTRGGSWPAEPVTKEFDLLDLAWHEREFRDGNSFAYVVYNDQKEYVGCFYLYPMGHRTELNEEKKDFDMDASWWVASDAYDVYYKKLYLAMQQWLKEFSVSKVYYSNREIPT